MKQKHRRVSGDIVLPDVLTPITQQQKEVVDSALADVFGGMNNLDSPPLSGFTVVSLLVDAKQKNSMLNYIREESATVGDYLSRARAEAAEGNGFKISERGVIECRADEFRVLPEILKPLNDVRKKVLRPLLLVSTDTPWAEADDRIPGRGWLAEGMAGSFPVVVVSSNRMFFDGMNLSGAELKKIDLTKR